MLSKAVFATIVYYDVLDYPLTTFEVWKHLLIPEGTSFSEPATLLSVRQALESMQSAGRIESTTGFWLLPHRIPLINQRIQREKMAVQKVKRAATLIRWCSWIPYVRMIALTGSLSLKQVDRNSDWDFLVVLKGGAIWTGRFMLTFWLTLLGQRRHGQRVTDRACLNAYLTDTHLDVPLKDLFSSHEYRFLYPVIGQGMFQSFELANRWMTRYRPHFAPTLVDPFFLRPPLRWIQQLQALLEVLLPLRWLERYLGAWQRRLIERNPKTALPGSFILVSDTALMFLPQPKGPQLFEIFKERLSQSL